MKSLYDYLKETCEYTGDCVDDLRISLSKEELLKPREEYERDGMLWITDDSIPHFEAFGKNYIYVSNLEDGCIYSIQAYNRNETEDFKKISDLLEDKA